MSIVLTVLVLVGTAELLLYSRLFWRLRRILAPFVAIILGVIGGALFVNDTDGWSYVGLAIALYRCGNLIRVAYGISTPEYLRKSGFRTSLTLLLAYIANLGVHYLMVRFHGNGYRGWLLLACLELAGAVVVASATRRTLRHTLPAITSKSFADHDLPSISVAIPARNETESLQRCLQSLLASDYPKLEVLVLDDCSQDKTSDVIKEFAHEGVRFLKGDVPPEGWLAKNWAYEQLYRQANGQLILFCGADISVGSSTLRSLVTTMLLKQKSLICVMPYNVVSAEAGWMSVLLQPMRYAWEISLPRRLFNRPPVLSSYWAVERDLLKDSGGFAAVRGSISPESHFARNATRHDAYSFVRSTEILDVVATKTYADQLETAVRTRYPQLHRRPELVLLLCLVECLLVVATLPLAIAGLLTAHWLLAALAGVAFVLYSHTFGAVVTVTYHAMLRRAYVAVIPALLLDIALRNYSACRYEFTEVTWKGRNVCLPIMQVLPRLPAA